MIGKEAAGEVKYLFACCTDTGMRKKKNQDSLLLKQAVCGRGQVVLAVICDGMGGLKKGEAASASVVLAFSGWFEQKLPKILHTALSDQVLFRSWDVLLKDLNARIGAYGRGYRIQLGTTVTAMLFVENRYYMVHVGDCRAYEITDRIRQLTRDQTLVQQEVESGLLSREEAEHDERRNVLLQCIGASEEIRPAYKKGTIHKEAVYMLCCDGFCHLIREPEMLKALNPQAMRKEPVMERQLTGLTALSRARGEQDDVSVLAVRVCKERNGC